jgi:maltose alpha-D-glucosyltransferase / alpha-amylase
MSTRRSLQVEGTIEGGALAQQRRRAVDPLWFKDAVIYETHVKSFYDSNGDGIGDLRGLVEKLDYLQELGVNCLWLLPLCPSPLKDDGYDIADYRNVHPDYGTLEDFRQLVAAAHARGIRVLVELVVNHTSDQHPWFQRARRAPSGSRERDYYVWSDTDEKYKDARIIFTDTEKSNWTWDPEAKQYYWHRFFSHQPDLNFENPEVLREVLDALSFWAELGVDGFRLDAVPYLIEQDGTNCENLPATHAVIRKIRRYMDERFQGKMLLAEANQWPVDVRPYFGDGDECHMAFHFPLMPRIFMALRLEDVEPIIEIMRRTPPIPDTCQWALFLRNHDELTLEMVTADERDYMYLAYSQDPRMKINVGIRRRLGPLMENSRRRMELLNSLLFSFPGTPVVYYGDEIGMGDNIYLHDRNGVRTPMQWTPDRNAGFSRADPARLYSAPISDPVYGYQAVNVEAQLRDPSSLLHWMRNTIALRKLFKAFGRGTMEFLPVPNRKVLAYVRRYDEDVILCVANVSRFAQPAELDLTQFEGYIPVEILGYTEFPRIGKLPYFLTLGPYGFYWFELRKPG